MKKRIIIISILLLFTTGCNCEYNLTIDNNIYHEEINLTGTNSEEINNFNRQWTVPVDKNEYNLGLDSGNIDNDNDIYKYNLSSNILTFNYDFTKNKYVNSSAVSNCYDMLNIIERDNNIIISTTKNNLCFDKYPTLENLTINIKINLPVEKNNADKVNNNIYTWNITKENASNKSINLIIDNSQNTINSSSNSSTKRNEDKKSNNRDYSMYIFLGILLIIMLLGYFMFNKLKNKNNKMDD